MPIFVILLKLPQGSFLDSTTDISTIIVVTILLLLIVVFLVWGARSNRKRRGGLAPLGKKSLDLHRFRREAIQSLKLTKTQVSILEKIIHTHRIRHPFSLLHDSPTLQKTLRKVLDELNTAASTAATERLKLDLYRIKQHVERASSSGRALTNSRQLPPGQAIVLRSHANRKTGLVSSVISTSRETFRVQIPVNKQNERRWWPKGEAVTCLLLTLDGAEISFETKVVGYDHLTRGRSHLLLKNSAQLTKRHRRRYRRKSLVTPCRLVPITIVHRRERGRDEKVAITLNEKAVRGNTLDVSAGGASIVISASFKRGALLMLEFRPNKKETVVAYGKILDVKKAVAGRHVIHVAFTKASATDLNLINRFIYDL